MTTSRRSTGSTASVPRRPAAPPPPSQPPRLRRVATPPSSSTPDTTRHRAPDHWSGALSRGGRSVARVCSVGAEAERVSRRVEEDPEGRAGLVLVPGRAERQYLDLRLVEVVHRDVEVHLLRHLLGRPAWRGVGLDLLEADALAVVGTDLRPAGGDVHLPVEHRAVEGREGSGVGAVEDDAGEACDGHGGTVRPVADGSCPVRACLARGPRGGRRRAEPRLRTRVVVAL